MKYIYLSQKNLHSNLKIIKSKTKAKICAVLKANAYGHGVCEICKSLFNKVDFFGVANLQEALEIRSFDKTTKILIMGKCENFVLASENNISVTIFSKKEFSNLKKVISKIKNINIHLKINTGMNRIGLTKIEDFLYIISQIQKQKKFCLEGVFTHFSTLRNDIDYFRHSQEIFESFTSKIPSSLKPIIHGGGSLCLLYSNDYDMIRVGIFLYGYGLSSLKGVMSVKTKIIHTDHIIKNAFVGYSKAYIAENDMKIGIIPVGYADGIPRNFIGQFFEQKNKKFKILSVCMDMTILQIDEKTKVNSIVDVFDNATSWSKILNTNEHDVLVNFSSFRGKRINN